MLRFVTSQEGGLSAALLAAAQQASSGAMLVYDNGGASDSDPDREYIVLYNEPADVNLAIIRGFRFRFLISAEPGGLRVL